MALRAAEPAAPVLRVTPDHADWKYEPGEPVKFHVSLAGGAVPAGGLAIKFRVGPEMMPAEEKSAIVPPAGLTIEGGTMREPGFLRCVVTADLGGKTIRGLATAGFAPDKIAPTQTEPEDFDAFWAAAKTELAQVPLDARMTHLPDQSTAAIDVYHVSFQNVGVIGATFPSAHTRIYGILCVPKGSGPFPAMLRLPGATVRAYSGVRDLAAKGIITLEIGIHGIPVNLAPEVYAQLVSGVLASYPTYQLDDPRAYYYRRVYLGCVRANDFLCSLPQWDRKTLLVSGHSQGGQLTVATAVLDPRVNAVAVTFPAFCDVTGYLHGRAGGWPHKFRDERSGNHTPAKIATTGYYDTVNFARRMRVPGFYTWGFNDETCPPTSMFAAYNTITAPKSLFLALETGHAENREQLARVSSWLVTQAGAKSAAASPAGLAERARDVLVRAFWEESNWVRVHAAEVLIAVGRGAMVRGAFRHELPVLETGPARIGAWRVLAATAATPAERASYVEKITQVFLTDGVPDRLQAIESLAKLGVVLSGPALARAKVMATGPEIEQPFFLWALQPAGEAGALARLGELLQSREATARSRAAYALRWLRPRDPAILAKLTAALEVEAEDSAARPYLLSAALSLDANPALAIAWQREAETQLTTGMVSAQWELAQTLRSRIDSRTAERFAFLLEGREADTRIGGAWLALHALKQP